LDDLNLLFRSNGRPNQTIGTAIHVVHTVDDDAGITSPVGLTRERVTAAVVKVAEQAAIRARALADMSSGAAGGFSREEWALLKRSNIQLDLLRREQCPLWIKEAAKEYLMRFEAKAKKKQRGRDGSCLVF
jgi:hypothetical protein